MAEVGSAACSAGFVWALSSCSKFPTEVLTEPGKKGLAHQDLSVRHGIF